MNHSFDIGIAQKYSVEVAIFLNHIAFWTQKNIANNKHFHDGFFWTYNSYSAFLDIFPYWSIKNIRTIISRCIDDNLLIKGNFNLQRYDQTNWYALTNEALMLFQPLLEQFNTAMPKPATEAGIGLQSVEISEAAPSFSCPNRQMELPETANGVAGLGRPIPYTIPDTKTDNITPIVLSSKSTENEFDFFWNLYPSKKAKKKCLEIWKRRKLGMFAEEILSKLKIQIAEDDQWKRGFIPNPTTYLNQDRWDDDISTPKPDLKKEELIKKQLESSARMAEQERLSRIEHEQQVNRHKDYNQDGKAYRTIAKAVKRGDKSIPAGLSDLKRAAGVK